MGDAGFFKGTSAEQDQRFGDKQKKLLKSMKFPKLFDKKVDVKKVNMTVIRPWVTARVVEMVGFEDDVLIEFVFNLLEADKVDPRAMQIEISGFLEGNAPSFMKDLWGLLVSAQSTIGGIPQQFLDQKKAEIIKKRAEDEEIRARLEAQHAKEATERAERQAAPHLAALTAPPEDMPIPGTVMTEGAEAAMSALFMIEIGARIGGTMTAAATSIIMPLQGAGHETPESVIARRNRIVTEIGLAMNGVGQIEHERRQVRRVIQVIVAYAGGDPKAGAETRLQAVGVGLIRPGRQAQAAHTRATRDPTQDHQCRTLTRARTLIRAQIRADPANCQFYYAGASHRVTTVHQGLAP
ncbi:Serine/arginine repetitive matrix protein 1 [Geranomyces variabilis]|nr:Serine/arginine repetitive matrix protein 1 [Geranomyces variabilis]